MVDRRRNQKARRLTGLTNARIAQQRMSRFSSRLPRQTWLETQSERRFR
jgi:hypothetical protein